MIKPVALSILLIANTSFAEGEPDWLDVIEADKEGFFVGCYHDKGRVTLEYGLMMAQEIARGEAMKKTGVLDIRAKESDGSLEINELVVSDTKKDLVLVETYHSADKKKVCVKMK